MKKRFVVNTPRAAQGQKGSGLSLEEGREISNTSFRRDPRHLITGVGRACYLRTGKRLPAVNSRGLFQDACEPL